MTDEFPTGLLARLDGVVVQIRDGFTDDGYVDDGYTFTANDAAKIKSLTALLSRLLVPAAKVDESQFGPDLTQPDAECEP